MSQGDTERGFDSCCTRKPRRCDADAVYQIGYPRGMSWFCENCARRHVQVCADIIVVVRDARTGEEMTAAAFLVQFARR